MSDWTADTDTANIMERLKQGIGKSLIHLVLKKRIWPTPYPTIFYVVLFHRLTEQCNFMSNYAANMANNTEEQ